MGFLITLLGSSLGRKLALWGMAALGVALFIWRIYAAGQAREQARQLEASLKNLRERIKVDDELSQLTPDQRRERLNRWVQRGGS
jgi:hypothetical protein